MRWLFGGLLAASISMLGLSPALAVSCGPGTSGSINIELQGTSATCFGFGNGSLPSTPGGTTLHRCVQYVVAGYPASELHAAAH